jgi:hypothetical protein
VHAGPIPDEHLQRVIELRVSGHRLRDLAPLAPLRQLRRLWLRSPLVTDLGPLASLGALRELTLVGLPARDLGPLAALTRLERLRLERMPVGELGPLASLTRLEDLCLRRLLVDDLEPLTALGRLRVLEITDGATLAGLGAVARLRALRYLNLAGTRVLDASGISERPALYVEGLDPVATIGTPPSRPGLDGDGAHITAEISRAAERRLHWPCRVAGLALRAAQLVTFEDNPWRIPATTTLANACALVWGPLAQRAPRFSRRLVEEVDGLALIAPLGGDEPALAYLGAGDCACHPGRGLRLLLGAAPRDPARDRAQGFRLPLALRELYSVHAGLVADDTTLLGADGVRPLSALCLGRLLPFRRANQGLSPDQFRIFVTDEDGGKVLDLDRLDARGDPMVRSWYAETHEVAGQAPFWDWFEDQAPEALLHAP